MTFSGDTEQSSLFHGVPNLLASQVLRGPEKPLLHKFLIYLWERTHLSGKGPKDSAWLGMAEINSEQVKKQFSQKPG